MPSLAETETKVIEVVLERLACGWSAEEVHRQHPHLSVRQIHSALAYGRDHRDELDDDIRRRLDSVDRMREASSLSIG